MMPTKIQFNTDSRTNTVSVKSAGRWPKHLLILSCALQILITTVFAQSNTKATPQNMVDALHAAFGKHPDARAVHAKGIILEGTFTPTGDAKLLCKAPHFNGKTIPVTFRFSDFTGIPNIPDTIGASNPRGFAIKFHLPDGSSTDIVCHSFNGFPTATTDEFREFLLAVAHSGPDALHPNPIEQFLAVHPIAKTFLSTQKPPSVSYATLSYFGVNAFKFTNKKGESHYIRYQFIPETGEEFLSKEAFEKSGPDYLSEEIKTRVSQHPVKFKLYAQIAQTGDKIEDPSVAWPESRKRVLLGTLTIDSLGDNTLSNDHSLTFNPGNLPQGITIADQMLADRMKAYPISVQERRNP
jgi:catalase